MAATGAGERPENPVAPDNERRDYAEGRAPTPAIPVLLAIIGGHLLAVGLGPTRCVLLTAAAWLGALVIRRRPWSAVLCATSLGTLLPGMAVEQGLAARLDGAQLDGIVTGRIVRVQPLRSPRMIVVQVSDYDGPGGRPRRVRLNLYRPLDAAVGEHWELPVRLRAPRGLANRGTGDPERNLFRMRIDGVGYVRDDGARRLARAPAGPRPDALRAWVSARIAAAAGESSEAGPPRAGSRHLQALLVGDRSALEAEDWALLAATGTTHLLVVSGLHVGMVAAMTLFLAGLAGSRARRPGTAALVVLAVAGAYAFITGFELPARRAWLMLAVGSALLAGKRSSNPFLALAWAGLAVLLLEPLAPLAAGFWLSFLAVAALLLVLSGRTVGAVGVWRGTLLAQLTVSTFLAVPLAVSFGRIPLSAPVINLVAIPLVGVVLLPAGLLLLVGLLLGVPGAAWAMEKLASGLGWTLSLLAALPDTTLAVGPGSALAAGAAVLAAAVVWMPWPWLLRMTAGCLLAALLWPVGRAPPEGSFRVHLFDVGQGLAAVVRTRSHTLVYDTGPPFGVGADAGGLVVVPALRSLGVRHVDRILISHDHADHSGGLNSVRRAWPAAGVSAPTPLVDAGLCHAGQHWRWDGVDFDILLPEPGVAGDPRHFNRHSCVLRIRSRTASVLLPGDIDAHAERRLAADVGRKDLVVAPHHGSRSSSGRVLVRLTQPRLVWVSAGCPSRFGHPHPEVVKRWRSVGAEVQGTGPGGMLSWDSDRPQHVVRERDRRRRYWHWPGGGAAPDCGGGR